MSSVLESIIIEDRKDRAVKMLKEGELVQEEIAKYSRLSLEEIEEIAKEL